MFSLAIGLSDGVGGEKDLVLAVIGSIGTGARAYTCTE